MKNRKLNTEYAAEFAQAAQKSPEAGALALVGMTTMLRVTDKGPNNTIRNLGYAFKHALAQIKPHMEDAAFTPAQQKSIQLAEDSLQVQRYSY